MGLDVRTGGKENQLVFATADGYIAKIGIQASGFGRVIYINHPNGLTTVYAHLNNFFPQLEEYVTRQQYSKKSWALELEFNKDQFPVTKGSFIAYSGNTGGSQGPHVHFEIRDTKTDECLNPLFFGFPLADNVPPTITKLALYDRTKSTYNSIPQFFAVKNTDSGYIIPKIPLVKTGNAAISFGLQTFDRMSGSDNQDGVYAAELFVDNEFKVKFVMDSISYDETGYFNAHIDYLLKYNGGPFFQHLSKLPGEKGGVYHPYFADGVVRFNDTAVHDIRINVKDVKGNVSVLNVKMQFDDKLAKTPVFTSSAQKLLPNRLNELRKPDFEMIMPEYCLFDTVQSFYYKTSTAVANAVSAVHQVNDMSVPVHNNLLVRIKPDKNIPAAWKDKIVIHRSYRNSSNVRKAVWDNDWLTASFSDFGNFCAYADIIPPVINELGKADTIDLSPANRIVFTPTDNFGISSFSAMLDGEWLRFTNDKGRNWVYIFDERCPDGVHELKVRVEDLAGNVTEKTWWFKKYPYTPPVKKKKTSTKKGSTKKTAPAKKKSVTKKKK